MRTHVLKIWESHYSFDNSPFSLSPPLFYWNSLISWILDLMYSSHFQLFSLIFCLFVHLLWFLEDILIFFLPSLLLSFISLFLGVFNLQDFLFSKHFLFIAYYFCFRHTLPSLLRDNSSGRLSHFCLIWAFWAKDTDRSLFLEWPNSKHGWGARDSLETNL